jgi:hypothetical protein
MGLVIVAYVAMGLMFAIMSFRSLGLGAMQSKVLRDEGRPQLAKYRNLWLRLLWLGTGFTVIWAFTQIQFFRVIGISLWLVSILFLILSTARALRGRRQSAQK